MSVTKGFARTCQFIVHAVNISLFLFGFVLLVLAVWIRVSSYFSDLVSDEYRRATSFHTDTLNVPIVYVGAWLALGNGVVAIICGFLGCFGAITVNRICLILYIACLLALLISQLGYGVWAFANRDEINNQLGEALQFMVQRYGQSPEILRETLDALQNGFLCCGDSGCGDFDHFGINRPRSCGESCDGCRLRIFNVLTRGFSVLATIGVVTAVMELIGIIAAFCLVCISSYFRPTYRRYRESAHMEVDQSSVPDTSAEIPDKEAVL